MTLTTEVKARLKEVVFALNYRRKPNEWELGQVVHIEIHVGTDMTTSPHYTVRLLRESASGNAIFITVGNDGIKKI